MFLMGETSSGRGKPSLKWRWMSCHIPGPMFMIHAVLLTPVAQVSLYLVTVDQCTVILAVAPGHEEKD